MDGEQDVCFLIVPEIRLNRIKITANRLIQTIVPWYNRLTQTIRPWVNRLDQTICGDFNTV